MYVNYATPLCFIVEAGQKLLDLDGFRHLRGLAMKCGSPRKRRRAALRGLDVYEWPDLYADSLGVPPWRNHTLQNPWLITSGCTCTGAPSFAAEDTHFPNSVSGKPGGFETTFETTFNFL